MAEAERGSSMPDMNSPFREMRRYTYKINGDGVLDGSGLVKFRRIG
jgi:hypothetical protein